MRGVADALGGLEAVEVGLLPLDVDGVEGVEAEPRREGEPVLVGQLRDRRQDDGLDSADGVEGGVDRVCDDGLDVLHHEGVRRVDEVVGVALGRALQAQLAVDRHLRGEKNQR